MRYYVNRKYWRGFITDVFMRQRNLPGVVVTLADADSGRVGVNYIPAEVTRGP